MAAGVVRPIWAGALVTALASVVQAQNPLSAVALPAAAGTIVGTVTVKDGGLPLGYSVVSIEAAGRERFTDEHGAFRLADLPPGPTQLRVRHLGYSPATIGVTVHPGGVDTVSVALTHIAVRLTAVEVRGYPQCKNPGAPSAAEDPQFATVFEQLRQNAEQYRLLTREYPFDFAVERMMATARHDGQLRTELIDTVPLSSTARWHYEPGAVVGTERTGLFGRNMVLNLPTLVSFADDAFISNHCFHNGGLETVDGRELLRVDFVAASRIRDPDVDGSMYLDPQNFQIRRAFLHLSKIPRGARDLAAVEVTTLFGEIFPSVPGDRGRLVGESVQDEPSAR